MSQQQITKQDDPKTWVTPFAFDVAPNILYLPLASPLKRGLSMLIDGLLVAVLAESAGWLFILLVLGTLLVQKQSKAVGKAFKWGLYLLMLVVLLSSLVGYFSDVTVKAPQDSDLDSNNIVLPENSQGGLATLTEMAGYIPAVIVASQCEDFACAQKSIAEVKSALANTSLNTEAQSNIINDLVIDLPLTMAEKQQLHESYTEVGVSEEPPVAIANSKAELNDQTVGKNGVTELSSSGGSVVSELETRIQELETIAAKLEQQAKEQSAAHEQRVREISKNSDESSSPLAWINGLLNDLGLGFGWAAFYFTVFTAWFDGQTLGKKLFGIRVIQLDGTKISLWDAFGRYGGYAAGFTTGLLGFFQIYWDANRQAIQDKISATVVIDVRKTRHEVALEHAPIDNKSNQLAIDNGSTI
ncbi:RDD family protein [Shewanella sp. MBTL60-007]|uniref:RDD family protein n=1 Tax=Shewanella sp. MBTL60-007 TaxID=2815911 RepID=UPI001BBB0BDD|nr:RDD family protein [Shewanella sp. MBTL60-007]GIU26280.1 RDD domain protein [Shewanella sp. MBTL60-007]